MGLCGPAFAGHAFFNDTGGSFNAEAAKDAWAKLLAWFAKYLSAGPCSAVRCRWRWWRVGLARLYCPAGST